LNNKHLFISGPPRSGTTLLELIMSAHSQITITPETHFIQKIIKKKYMPPKLLSAADKQEISHLMKNDRKLNSWPTFNLLQSLEKLHIDEVTLAGLLDQIFLDFARSNRGGSLYIGNKKGLYAEGFGPYIKKLFPDARFIYIVRDPRDVTRSILKNLESRTLKSAASLCSDRYAQIKKMLSRFPAATKIIRYEDLVLKPEKAVSDLCAFLGINFEPAMLYFYKHNLGGSRLMAVTKTIHANTSTPLNPALVNQWAREDFFSNEQLILVETINFRYMQELDYKPTVLPGKAVLMLTALKGRLKYLQRRLKLFSDYHLK